MSKPLNIYEYVTFDDENKWLQYQADNITFVTEEGSKAYCFAIKGKFHICIGQENLKHGNEFLVELIKHELGHGLFKHLEFMNGKEKLNRQLFNILADCSIHTHMASPDILDIAGLVCTYERQNLPMLPPEILYNKLENKVDSLEQWIEDNLNDNLWEQEVTPLEQDVISNGITNALNEAEKNGHGIPAQFKSAGTETGQGVDYEYFSKPVKKDKWLEDLLRKVRNRINTTRQLSWHRESRNIIGGGIMQRGLATTNGNNRFLFAIDVSGSMNPRIVERGLNNIIQHSGLKGDNHEVIFFDTRISSKYKLKDTYNIYKEACRYGGGTDVKALWEYAKPDDHLVIFTDGYIYDLSRLQPRTIPPIWVLTNEISRHYLDQLTRLGELVQTNY